MKLTVQRKLIAVALLPVLGLAACGWLGFEAFRAAGVGGPAVRRLLATYEVAADVTPAVADLASSFATVQSLAAGGDADHDAVSLRELRASHEAFEQALEGWTKHLPAGTLRDALVQRVGRTGRDYVAQCEDDFVPALRRGDRARAAAVAAGPLRRAYDAHRRALDDLAPLVAAQRRADAAAAAEAADGRVRLLVVLCALVGVASLAFGVWVANRTVYAVTELRRVARAMAAGDLGAECAIRRGDEVGQLADAIQLLRGSLQAVIAPLANKSMTLAHASEELSNVSFEMSSTAEETSSQASTVSTSSHQVSRSVETVAVAVEQMSASVLEISKNTGEAARIASDAAAEAQATNAKVSKLGESSSEIGNVIQVINAIAQQTNLLALNAAIEAARAGEAGKGFAVVANEVKELAKGTAAATEDISHKIVTIQSDTAAAITAIAAISATIQQIKDISNSIASAVDEQLATTSEIGRSLAEAARGASEISDGVLNVAQAAKDTAAGSARTQVAAGELARMAAELRRMTERFRLGAPPAETRRLPVDERAGADEPLARAA